ncbi:hypothetical protein HG530_005183 [Fusarium avenaceum]|nr:hypothetical protein HG530_005183 [Fusarium avenaceum]
MDVVKARLTNPNGLFKKLEIEACPRQIGDTQTANCIKYTNNLYDSRLLRGIVVGRTIPLGLNLGSSVGLLLGWHAVDPFHISLRLAKFQTIWVLLVQGIKIWEILQVAGADDANVGDETCHRTSCVSSAREAKAKDLIAEIVVEDDEVVCFDHIAHKTNACTSLTIRLCLTQISSANTSIVVYYLLPDLSVLVLAAAGDGAGDSCHVGWDVLQSRN